MPEILEFDKMFYKNFEPKMGNRFIMEINGIESYIIKTANRPTFTSEVVELDHINVKRKLKGKSTWDDVTITLYDPIVPSGAQQVMEWIRTSHESLTGRDGYSAFYKKDITFFLLGPVGDKIEQWTLKGAFITSANFGELDWASNDPVSIELTLAYDYAILEY
jgi:T4-like virus tail tube protein gp19